MLFVCFLVLGFDRVRFGLWLGSWLELGLGLGLGLISGLCLQLDLGLKNCLRLGFMVWKFKFGFGLMLELGLGLMLRLGLGLELVWSCKVNNVHYIIRFCDKMHVCGDL